MEVYAYVIATSLALSLLACGFLLLVEKLCISVNLIDEPLSFTWKIGIFTFIIYSALSLVVIFFAIGMAMPFADSHQSYPKSVQEILKTLNAIADYLAFPLLTIKKLITVNRENDFLICIGNGILVSYFMARIATWLKNYNKA
jgi:hypothetical protein